jgi:DNA-binding CsgD family transcriptional regulator
VYTALGRGYTELEAVRFLRRETGVFDGFQVKASQTHARGCAFVGPLNRVRSFPARTAGVLSRVARHIAAAQRLRQSVQRTDHRISLDAEAVLDQRGAVLHAEGEARGKVERKLLADATRTLVGAKGRFLDSDPEQVTSLWNALVDGRWSLVDSFDSDGKRFLLARRNALELPEPSALTPAERQVAALFARGHSSKLVAYELGHSASVVSSTLQRALRKLHLRSRAELIALFTKK